MTTYIEERSLLTKLEQGGLSLRFQSYNFGNVSQYKLSFYVTQRRSSTVNSKAFLHFKQIIQYVCLVEQKFANFDIYKLYRKNINLVRLIILELDPMRIARLDSQFATGIAKLGS